MVLVSFVVVHDVDVDLPTIALVNMNMGRHVLTAGLVHIFRRRSWARSCRLPRISFAAHVLTHCGVHEVHDYLSCVSDSECSSCCDSLCAEVKKSQQPSGSTCPLTSGSDT